MAGPGDEIRCGARGYGMLAIALLRVARFDAGSGNRCGAMRAVLLGEECR